MTIIYIDFQDFEQESRNCVVLFSEVRLKMFNRIYLITHLIFLASSYSFAQQKVNYRKKPLVDSAVGIASFYANKFEGKKTASGEIFRQSKMTCAHNTHPFGTDLKVTNLNNGNFVIVKVNDRLHHRNSRLVDLSAAAAKKLDFNGKGVIKVRVEVVKPPQKDLSPPK